MGLFDGSLKQGYGSTNDGNLAWRFFENHHHSICITGIDIEIINNFKVV
jgi:hypothetical protein